MADETILKSFLYLLGTKVDEPSMRKAEDRASNLTKIILGAGAAIEGMSLALAVATVKMADNFEKLYYSSQRTGASITGMKSFEFAVGQLGGTAEAAHASLEKIAEFNRRNPMGAAWFKQNLGVDRRNGSGQLKDEAAYTEEIYKSLYKLYALGGNAQAKSLSLMDFLGLDEDTLRAVGNAKFDKILDERSKRIKQLGVDQEKTGERSALFMQQVRDLGSVFGDLRDKVLSDLELKYGDQLEHTTDTLIKNLPVIAHDIETVLEDIQKVVTALGGWQQATEDLFALWAGAKVFGAIASVTKFVALLRLAGAVGGAGAGAGAVEGAAVAEGAAGLGFGALAVGIVPVVAAAVLAWFAGKAAAPAAHDLIGDNAWDSVGGGVAEFLASLGDKDAQEAVERTNNPSHTSDKDKTTKAMDFFMGSGWSAKQAAGIVARATLESNLEGDPAGSNDNGTAQGVFQWHKPGQDEFRNWAGNPRHLEIKNAPVELQYAFANYQLRNGSESIAGNLISGSDDAGGSGFLASKKWIRPGLTPEKQTAEAKATADLAKQIYARYGVPQKAPYDYSKALHKAFTDTLGPSSTVPASVSAEQSAQLAAALNGDTSSYFSKQLLGDVNTGGDTHVTLNNDVNINVQGSDDPKATGAAVASQQGHATGTLLRNVKGALQ